MPRPKYPEQNRSIKRPGAKMEDTSDISKPQTDEEEKPPRETSLRIFHPSIRVILPAAAAHA